MVRTYTRSALILARGARCQVCKCTRWKGGSILPALVMARKDLSNREYTEDNVILVCRMCFYTNGYNRRTIIKRRTKAEMLSARTASMLMVAESQMQALEVVSNHAATYQRTQEEQ